MDKKTTRVFACLMLASFLLSVAGCQSFTNLAHTLEPAPANILSDATDLSSADEVVFLVIGDTGRGGTQIPKDVGQAMAQTCAHRKPTGKCDFALVAGDLIYPRGVSTKVDPQFESKFDDLFAPLQALPMWLVPGNHDWMQRGSVQAQIFRSEHSKERPQWLMPFNHYAVPKLPRWLAIYGLDTTVIHDLHGASDTIKPWLRQVTNEQVAAARTELCGRPGWRFIFGHHPVYSSGRHGQEMDGATGADQEDSGIARTMHDELVGPLITRCRVQVYFAGHDHHQEWLYSKKENFHQVVQGAVAEALEIKGFKVTGVESRGLCSGPGFGLARVSAGSFRMEFYAVHRDASGLSVRGCEKAALQLDANTGGVSAH